MPKRKTSDLKSEPKPGPLAITSAEPTTIESKYDLKLVCWNVAGFRAIVKKGFDIYFEAEKPDIICLQETKCSEFSPYTHTQDTLLAQKDEYQYYWHTNEKPGYAGVSVWTKVSPLKVTKGILNDETNQGRAITLEFDNYFLVAVYVPNSGDKLVNLDYRRKWNQDFKDYVVSLDKKKPVIICGDMNVSHFPIDLKNPETNKRSAGFTDEEREDFTELLSCGFVDTFRHLNPEKTGAYTYWSYRSGARKNNTGWRLDYFLVSERILENCVDCVIRPDVIGSDHCPVVYFTKTIE